MDKDNEIYVTSNGELYKKGVEQAINPQTNYTTQQFYTKEEYDKLQAENKRLKEENKHLTEKEEEAKHYLQEAYKFHQALQEIRDIILSPEIIDEETKKLHTSEELDNIVRWHREDKLSKIKDKINEVIGAEE